MDNEKEIVINKDDLKTLIKDNVDEAVKAIEEKHKAEDGKKKVPEPLREGFRSDAIKVNIVKPQENRLGMLLRALGKSEIEKKTIATVFTEWGKEVRNYLPEDIEKQIKAKKSLNMSLLASGGAMVFEDYASDFIDLLTAKSVLRKAGVPVIDMPNGNITFTKVTGGTTAYWRGETENKRASTPTYGQVKLDTKILVGQVAVSDQLLRYGSLNVDAMVQNRLLEDVALKEDITLLLEGTGTVNTPKSLYNWTPSGNRNTMTASPTSAKVQSDLYKMKRQLLAANIPMVKPTWFMTPSARNYIEAQVDSNSNLMFWAAELINKGTLLGIPVETTTQLIDSGGTTSNIILADLNATILGQGMSLTIKFKEGGNYYNGTETKIGDVTGESVYTCELEEDFAVAHAEAITRLTGVTWGI